MERKAKFPRIGAEGTNAREQHPTNSILSQNAPWCKHAPLSEMDDAQLERKLCAMRDAFWFFVGRQDEDGMCYYCARYRVLFKEKYERDRQQPLPAALPDHETWERYQREKRLSEAQRNLAEFKARFDAWAAANFVGWDDEEENDG